MKEIEVPSYWEEYELTDATTCYGNHVRMPKKWKYMWDEEKQVLLNMLSRGWDPKDGSVNLSRIEDQDMIKTLLELYHKPD